MNVRKILDESLKARIVLATLLTIILSYGVMSFVTNDLLKNDTEHLLSEQQFSTASLMASEIDLEIGMRFAALKKAASRIPSLLPGKTKQLQQYLEGRESLEAYSMAVTTLSVPRAC